MGNVVVYVPAGDERSLKNEGHDPGDWVRNLVRRALEERRQRIFPEPPPARQKDLK